MNYDKTRGSLRDKNEWDIHNNISYSSFASKEKELISLIEEEIHIFKSSIIKQIHNFLSTKAIFIKKVEANNRCWCLCYYKETVEFYMNTTRWGGIVVSSSYGIFYEIIETCDIQEI